RNNDFLALLTLKRNYLCSQRTSGNFFCSSKLGNQRPASSRYPRRVSRVPRNLNLHEALTPDVASGSISAPVTPNSKMTVSLNDYGVTFLKLELRPVRRLQS